jgi:endoglucanase
MPPEDNSLPFLSVSGKHIINANNDTVVLHGVSFGWHNFWPRFYTEETVDWIAEDFKVNVVRAAIGVEPSRGFLEDTAFAYKCLDAVVNAAIKNNLYVIIDWHSHHIQIEAAKTFFTRVANRYSQYPNVIYEIFNEPEYDSWKDVKDYSIDMINTIRAIDKKNLILVGSPHWDQDVDSVADNPITGYGNIAYTFHFYAATHKEWNLARVEYAINKGLPIFVSECASMEATGDGPIDTEQWNVWLNFMNKHKISRVAWSVSDKLETCSMVKDATSPISHWTDADLKPWGQMVRKGIGE